MSGWEIQISYHKWMRNCFQSIVSHIFRSVDRYRLQYGVIVSSRSRLTFARFDAYTCEPVIMPYREHSIFGISVWVESVVNVCVVKLNHTIEALKFNGNQINYQEIRWKKNTASACLNGKYFFFLTPHSIAWIKLKWNCKSI